MQGSAYLQTDQDSTARRAAMATLARARLDELKAARDRLAGLPGHSVLRGPEIGLLMARGRIGGGGAPFNLGEVTMSRAVVRLASGEVGFGQCLGRSQEKALLAAIFDALWQAPSWRDRVESELLAPVGERLAAESAARERQTAATRVNFFTLVRGED